MSDEDELIQKVIFKMKNPPATEQIKERQHTDSDIEEFPEDPLKVSITLEDVSILCKALVPPQHKNNNTLFIQEAISINKIYKKYEVVLKEYSIF